MVFYVFVCYNRNIIFCADGVERKIVMTLLTREQIIEMVTKIMNYDYNNDEEYDNAVEELKKGVIDPNISDYIFWDNLTPEQVADKALSYKPILL